MSDEPVLPDGIVLQHTLYGEPDRTVTHAWATPGTVHAPFSGVDHNGVDDGLQRHVEDEPYIKRGRAPERAGHCIANDDTCKGFAMRDALLCPAHNGVLRGRGHKASERSGPPHIKADP